MSDTFDSDDFCDMTPPRHQSTRMLDERTLYARQQDRIAALEAELAAVRDAANRIEGDEILARLRSGSATNDEQYNVANSLAYLWAQDGLLSEAQREVDRLREQLAEVERPLDAQMTRLNANLINANRAKIDAERELAAERERREAAEALLRSGYTTTELIAHFARYKD